MVIARPTIIAYFLANTKQYQKDQSYNFWYTILKIYNNSEKLREKKEISTAITVQKNILNCIKIMEQSDDFLDAWKIA